MENTLVASKTLEAKVLLRCGLPEADCVVEAYEMPMTKIRWGKLWIKGRRDCAHCRHAWTPVDLNKSNVKDLIWLLKAMKRRIR